MKNKINLLILALCAASAVWGTTKSGLSEDGKTYYIASKADLVAFANAVNGGQYSLNAVVTADIDMAHEQSTNSWTTPIGTLDHPYTGTFDGQCYEIKNFLIYRKGSDLKNLAQIGFFGAISGATIKNIILSSSLENNIEDVSGCTAAAQAGILVGLSGGSTIDNCQVSANLFTNVGVNVGGIVGSAGTDAKDIYKKQNTISRCSCAGTWRIRGKSNYGGIVGYSYYSTIENCYNLTILPLNQGGSKNNDGRVGGILGYVNVSSTARPTVVKNCYNYGKVSNETTNASPLGAVGAIAGRATGSQVKFINCYYLSTSCDKVCGQVDNNSKDNVTATSKSAEDFKTLAASLGDEFVDGTDYPVFAKLTPALAFVTTEFEVIAEAKSSIENSLVDLVEGAYPNFGTLTYSMTGDAIGTLVDGTANVNLNGATGTATITASVAGSNYYEEAVASYTITVKEPPTPVVTFSGITDGKKSVALNVESFTEAATVDMTVPVVYSSSKTNVATVDNNGKVTVLTTGTTEITAIVEAKKGEYKEASATYTLTVTASEASEKSFVEKFSGVSRCNTAKDDCGYIEAENFIGTDGLFHWTVNSVRLRKGDVIGKGGLRFSTSLEEGSYHLLPDPNYNDGIMEGGIKRIAFTYKKANGGSGANLEISAGEVLRYVKSNSETETQFAANFFVKENTSLKMFNTKGASVVTIGPISIVPYLLFTTKSDEAFLSLVEEYDVKDVLINNTDNGTVVYSILTADAQSQISNEGVVTFTNVTKSETITIQAAWTPAGKSSATVTTTMTLYVDAEYKTDKTVEEKFSNYGATGWTNSEGSEVTKNGDVYDWRTKLTRHKTTDKLIDGQQAIWFAQDGYVATADAEDNTKVGPAEGGIKRIAFDWNQNGADQTGDDLYISVSVDGTEMSAIRRDGGAQPTEKPWQYIHNLNVKKNATLKIENKSTTSEKEGGRVKIGTIVITPYLLYTKKELSAKLSDETAINVDICNNTIGGAITYSSLNPEVASLANDDPSRPDKLKLNSVGDAVIVATWTPDGSEEVVTTSYTLHVTEKADRGLFFQNAVKETTVGGSGVTNTLNGTLDATEQTWSTASDDAITSVDNDGLVSAVAIGTDTVTVVVAESDAYQEGTASYKVIVRTGVDDNKKLVESFSGISKDASTSETEWKGDLKDYFSWKVKSTRHIGTAGDTIGGAGVAGTVLFAKGQIVTDGVIEGGIKYFTFNWKQPYVEQGATLRLTLNAGDKAYQQDYVVATDNGSTTHEHLYFAGNMQVKKNVQLTLKNESFKTDGVAALTENGRIAIDKFEIVPYLYYKTKSHKIDVVGGDEPTWTNEDLIDNTEGGTVEYSIEDVEGEGVAEIDATSGQVTAKSNGKAKVTATWTPTGALEGEVVTTTYEVEVFYSKLDAELAFDPEEISVGVDAIAFSTPTLNNPHGLSVTYSSSKENIAAVAEDGSVTLKGVAGDVTISATSEETDTYKEGSASYTIHVLPLPDVSFPNLTGTDNIKTVDMDQVPFTEKILVNEEDVTSSTTITYESSNEEVAIIKNNKVNIIGVGTAYITAKITQTEIYAGRDVYYTLTVEDKTHAEKQWTETFSSIGNVNDYITSRKADIVGDSSIYSWAMRNYRRKQTQADSLATEQAIRLSNAKNNYIETLNNQEGGIKRISFNWRTPGTEAGQLPINLNVSVCYNNYQDTVKRPMTRAKSKDNMTDNSYCSNFFVKQNAKLKIDIADETYSVMLIGPITITPYLLYTTKSADLEIPADDESATYKNTALIDNRDNEVAISYSVSEGASVDDEGTVTVSAAGEYTVTASWNEGKVTTTYTLKVTKAEDPDPEPNFVLKNKTAGAISTICLPKKIASVENATLYSISHGNKSTIEFVEADLENDAAGMPYLVQVIEDGDVNFYYGEGEAVTEPVDVVIANGFVGSLSEGDIEIPNNSTAILISGGLLHIAGEWCVLTKNHAYIDSNNLPGSAAPVVGAPRRTIRLYNPDMAPTNLVESESESGKAMKVLRDGQFYIICDTKTYNAQGILVE